MDVVVVGGDSPKMRKRRPREWTRKKEQAFFSALAETCNVTLASKAAAISPSSAYRRRKSHAAFRAGWAEALGAAYQRLELVLLERALNGTEKVVRRKDGSEERMRDYSDQAALALLRMHRDGAKEAVEQPGEEELEEARERLFDKLQRLRKRIETEEGSSA